MSQSSTISSPATPSFQLTHPGGWLDAHGACEFIETSAADGHEPAGRFQTHVREAFARARVKGIDRPILVGAIPYDTNKPSSLFIAKQVSVGDTMPLPRGTASLPTAFDIVCHGKEKAFHKAVEQVLQAVAKGGINKAVLSRTLDLHHPQPPDPSHLYQRLIVNNPTAYNFCYRPNGSEAWVGASPELLLSLHAGKLRSHPLAGSISRGLTPVQDQYNAERLKDSIKDLREHAWVVKDIRYRLAPFITSLSEPKDPSLCSTTTMWHLGTLIEATTDPQANALQLACLLHPTPAICGYPTTAARQIIEHTETHDRKLYGGMLGWCDEAGNGEWILTLRCAHVQGKMSRLFAGAGIIQGSCADAEWAETSSKLKTMIHAFQDE